MSISARARIAKWNLGSSVEGRPLEAWAFAPEGMMCPQKPSVSEWKWFLLIAGVHGDEIEGVAVVESMLEGFAENHPLEHIGVIVWPCANPDGFAKKIRHNAAGVDLNRNLPTVDWTAEVKNPRYPPGPKAGSEPETAAMVNLIDSVKPVAIVSVHSFHKPMVNSNGPARLWSEAMSLVCNSPVTEDMGYPTPGCLGTYAGFERKIPTVTLELLRGERLEVLVPLHTMTIMTGIAYWDKAPGELPGL